MFNNLIFKGHRKLINKNKGKIIKSIKIWNMKSIQDLLEDEPKKDKNVYIFTRN
jgi:hypothetical protein